MDLEDRTQQIGLIPYLGEFIALERCPLMRERDNSKPPVVLSNPWALAVSDKDHTVFHRSLD